MDGLECKEIERSELERTLRIDSEFYSKSAINVSDMLQSRSHDLLTTYVNVSDGNHMGISDHFTDEGVPYYRGQDAGAFFIENSNPICIDEKTFELPVIKRSHLKKGDVFTPHIKAVTLKKRMRTDIHVNPQITCGSTVYAAVTAAADIE